METIIVKEKIEIKNPINSKEELNKLIEKYLKKDITKAEFNQNLINLCNAITEERDFYKKRCEKLEKD